MRRDPYPDFGPFETRLPNLGAYRLDRARALMQNSGLVAVTPDHLPMIEDAVALIDKLWAAGLRRHDIDQFAVAEMFRLGGVDRADRRRVRALLPALVERYMRRRLRRRRAGERIPFSKPRVRLFKAYWNCGSPCERRGEP